MRLPRIKARIVDLVRRRPGISAEELADLGSELINFSALTIRSRFVLEEDWDRAQEPVLAER
jgi:hypothetical protein